MSRSTVRPFLSVSALMASLALPSQFATAEPPSDLNQVQAFVNDADLSLIEVIKRAEQHTNGKAINATVMCQHDHGGATHQNHYKVCCLARGKIVEVCIDSDNGTILATHETTSIPPYVRTAWSQVDSGTSGTLANLRLQKATELIGKQVENPRGDNLGEVEDLAIDPDRGRVVYMVLSFGGFLGVGEKWFAIPYSAFTLSADGKHLTLAVEKDRLKTATGFDKERWPKMGDTSWATSLHEFYGQRPYWMLDADSTSPGTLRIQKGSELLGKAVQNDRGENLGEIKDLAIDADRGRIVYAVLSFGGFLGVADKLFAIPPGVLQMPGTAGAVVLTVDKAQLKNANGFEKDRWPNLADPTFMTATYKFYGQRPYGGDGPRTDDDRPHQNKP